VDQDVQALEALVNGEAQCVDIAALGQIQRDQGGRLARGGLDLVVQFFQRALIAAGGDHVGSGFGERQGAGAADAAGGAGDQCDAAVEGEGLSHDFALEAGVWRSAAPGRRRP
jgi:hypothetical protein